MISIPRSSSAHIREVEDDADRWVRRVSEIGRGVGLLVGGREGEGGALCVWLGLGGDLGLGVEQAYARELRL